MMTQKKLGFVTYKKYPRLTQSDILLAKSLEVSDYHVQNVPWDDERTEWEEYDTLILRSCWNYHLQVDNFYSWLKKIEDAGIKLWNPYSIVRSNLNKTYLFDLERKGIEIIPTLHIKKGSNIYIEDILKKNNWEEIVIKPTIGVDAYHILKTNYLDALAKQKDLDKLLENSDILIQPLIEEIKNGELSIIFFGNNYGHTVLKKPAKNDFRTNYDLGGSIEIAEIKPNILSQVKKIVGSIVKDILYARVDGVIIKGKFVLMELELIEPHLFLDLYPNSAELFAKRFSELNSI